MNTKKLILWICILFLLVSSVSAVPPVSVLFQGDTGLTIQTSPPRFLQAGSVGQTTIHVFNTTNGVLLTNETPGLVECFALIQWPNGTELSSEKATPHLNHFDFSLDLTDISLLGEYGWVMYCNNSYQGGFTSGLFELTNSGNEEKTTAAAFFYLIAIGMITLLFLISIYGIIKSESVLGRYIFIILTYLFFTVLSYISWRMADIFITNSSFLVWFLKFLFMFSLWSFLPFFFISISFLLYQLYKIKEIRSLVERGIPEEEAYKRIKKK